VTELLFEVLFWLWF